MTDEVLYIVMPAYNEEENIEKVVAQWYLIVEKINSFSRLLIVNDGSKDRTYEKLNRMQKDMPLLLAINKPNSGHGATCLFAYRTAIENGADFIFQTDSDGQTNPDEFWAFWKDRNKYDFQIGDRINRQDGFIRFCVTNVLRIVLWLFFFEWIKDPNTPFRLMKTSKLKRILNVIPYDFFLSNAAISAVVVKFKERYMDRRITFKPRQGEKNSINIKKIFSIGLTSLKYFSIIKKNISNLQND